MHLTTREVVADEKQAKEMRLDIGTHIVTTVVEADGASELASRDAKFECDVISVRRTDSGGVEFQVALTVKEPAPAVVEIKQEAVVPSAKDEAVAYFVEKGLTQKDAEAQVQRFGVDRVLKMREKELDEELAATVAKPTEAPESRASIDKSFPNA